MDIKIGLKNQVQLDDKLRELFLKYLLKIEQQIKSHFSFYFCEEHGENQNEYLDINNYNYIGRNKKDIDKLVKILNHFVNKNTDYQYINHSKKKYGNVPLWVLVNALTFGNILKMYQLSKNQIQAKIAINYRGINENQLSKLLIILTQFRNVCAHGERLYTYHTQQAIPDLLLHKKLKIQKNGQEYKCGKRDLFAVVIAMRYLLPNDWFLEFKKELVKEIDKYQKQSNYFTNTQLLNFIGFPVNWKDITKYKRY